jgi:GDPmannose 4,6-dehydratase
VSDQVPADARRRLALVTGVAGQDGRHLTARLLKAGYLVHGTVRPSGETRPTALASSEALVIHHLDLEHPSAYANLIATLKPDEVYNLGGMSSVAASFADPETAWRTSADAVEAMLEAVRRHTPGTRFYQSSSSEMFGTIPGQDARHDADAPLRPQSPYAAAKAAAHLLCGAYRGAFQLRIACGILFNHESSFRPSTFLTRKVVDHVRALQTATPGTRRTMPPLAMGNMAARRDWGFAPDYVDGMVRIMNQIEVRSAILGHPPEEDIGANYRDYVLGTGTAHAVWELVDRAYTLAGFPLEWDRTDQESEWSARLEGTATVAVVVDPQLLRPADPATIVADPSRATAELAWQPRIGLDPFLREMLEAEADG